MNHKYGKQMNERRYTARDNRRFTSKKIFPFIHSDKFQEQTNWQMSYFVDEKISIKTNEQIYFGFISVFFFPLIYEFSLEFLFIFSI